MKNLGSSDKDRNPEMFPSEIATTLISRDYKGLSNYASNGVLEIWKIQDVKVVKDVGRKCEEAW